MTGAEIRVLPPVAEAVPLSPSRPDNSPQGLISSPGTSGALRNSPALRRWGFSFIAAAMLGFFSGAAAAQVRCGVYASLVPVLVDKYGERRVSFGLTADGWVIEQWANTSSGSWTLLRKNAQGMFCFIASGEAFTQPQTIHEKGGAL